MEEEVDDAELMGALKAEYVMFDSCQYQFEKYSEENKFLTITIILSIICSTCSF